MRLSILRRITEIEEGVIRRGRSPGGISIQGYVRYAWYTCCYAGIITYCTDILGSLYGDYHELLACRLEFLGIPRNSKSSFICTLNFWEFLGILRIFFLGRVISPGIV